MENNLTTRVMSVRTSLRLYSVRVHLALSAAVTYLLWAIAQVPDAAIPIINSLPPEMRKELPIVVGPILVVLGIFARIKAQPKVTGNDQ